MSQINLLQKYLQGENREIGAIVKFIEAHIEQNWQNVFEENHDQLLDAYKKAGDIAYGTYLHLLFLPVNKQMKEAGLRPDTRLPGDLNISREWGNTDDWTDQERWMWSTLYEVESGKLLGTIVTKVYHDHTQLRIPCAPRVIALSEAGKEDVVAALSQRSDDFKNAREFQVEVAEFLRNK